MVKFPQQLLEDSKVLEFDLESFNSIVLLGANGSGKTRMSVWLEKNWGDALRISAQKSLNFPDFVGTTSIKHAKMQFFYGNFHENLEYLKQMVTTYKWGEKPATHLLNDFEQLMILLHTEAYDKIALAKSEMLLDAFKKESLGMKGFMPSPKTKLDAVIEIWEQIFSHRKLVVRAGYIEVHSSSSSNMNYNSSEMSDGERLVFYFIGTILCAEDRKFIIIDEPENHLHPSIIKKLWNLMEINKPECKFIFLTHDIDFAISRSNSKLIWLKEYSGNDVWDYEEILNNDLPNEIYFSLLGSRDPVIFVEGEKPKSYDYALYQLLFENFNIISVSSCNKVIEATKTFSNIRNVHSINAWGIIDRDRRTDDEVATRLSTNILVPKVAEIENLFLTEEVIKFVTKKFNKDPEKIFQKHKNEVMKIFEKEYKNQALQHSITYHTNKISNLLNSKFTTYSDYEETIHSLQSNFNNDKEYYNLKVSEFKKYLDTENYNQILKVFNFKKLLERSKLPKNYRLEDGGYYDFIFDTLKAKDENSRELKNIFLSYIEGADKLK